jgi:hypothetical protein
MHKTIHPNEYNGIQQYIEEAASVHTFFSFLKYFVIPFLVIAILLIIGSMVLSRYKFDKIAKRKKAVEEKINDFLIDLIFSNYDKNTIKDKINQFKKEPVYKNKWFRYLILNKLIHIKQNIKEMNPSLIISIYKEFGLNEYSRKLIKNRKWYLKSVGIYHYQSLDYKIKKGYIKPFLKSKNKYLKSNALIALISLSDENFGILDNYQEKISRADELKILDLIYQKKSTIPKTISHWLDNENSSVVILAIKLIVRYRDTFSNSQIEKLLSHSDPVVRKSITLAIRELFITEANNLLIKHYVNETFTRNKISILKTLGTIGDDYAKEFVFKQLSHEKDLDIKFEIVNCINKIDPTYLNTISFQDPLENEMINKIILHVKTPNLN